MIVILMIYSSKQKKFDGDKVCIKRLPVARINQIGKEGGQDEYVVSEIYVNS